jgi:hypothetical protein
MVAVEFAAHLPACRTEVSKHEVRTYFLKNTCTLIYQSRHTNMYLFNKVILGDRRRDEETPH